jgi:hypothetical protein
MFSSVRDHRQLILRQNRQTDQVRYVTDAHSLRSWGDKLEGTGWLWVGDGPPCPNGSLLIPSQPIHDPSIMIMITQNGGGVFTLPPRVTAPVWPKLDMSLPVTTVVQGQDRTVCACTPSGGPIFFFF